MIYIAGLHGTLWLQRRDYGSLGWSVGLVLFGCYNIIAAIGGLVK